MRFGISGPALQENTGMDWYRDIYLGNRASQRREELIREIEAGEAPANTYLVTLASGPHNQLEIVPARNVRMPAAHGELPMVVGIGCGRRETFELVRRITEDVYRETGDVRLREYFERMAADR